MRDWPSNNAQHVARRRAIKAIGLALASTTMLARSAKAQIRGPLRSSAFRSIQDALEAWRKTGGTLIIDRDYDVVRPLTIIFLPGLSYHLTTDIRRTLRYSGSSTFHWFLCLYSDGSNPVSIDGGLTLDGNSMVSIVFFARFENVADAKRRNFSVAGLVARNGRMRNGYNRIDGSRANGYGSSGMLFSGGFDRLSLRNIQVSNIGRDAGVGLPSSQGCTGISVAANLSGTQSAKHVLIEDFTVSGIDCDDPPGSEARGDMDAVLVFQSAEPDGTRPIIQRGVVREAGGRAIKVYAPGGGGVTRDLKIYRSIPGGRLGSVEVNHQHGDGTIENIEIFYSGRANDFRTTPIAMSSGHRRPPGHPFATGIVRNVTIQDTTGKAKYCLVNLHYGQQNDAAPRRYSIQNVRDSGLSGYVFMPGILGTEGVADISIDQVETSLTLGLFATEDASQKMRLSISNFTNRGKAAVPVKTFYDGRRAPVPYRIRYSPGLNVAGVYN